MLYTRFDVLKMILPNLRTQFPVLKYAYSDLAEFAFAFSN